MDGCYSKEVKDLLGEAVDDILNSASNGDFSDDQINTVVELLDDALGNEDDEPHILQSNHKKRMERDRFKSNSTEMRDILSDFYSWKGFEKTKEEWLFMLIGIFYHPDVSLNPLAKKLETHIPNQEAYAQFFMKKAKGSGGDAVGGGADGRWGAGAETKFMRKVTPS